MVYGKCGHVPLHNFDDAADHERNQKAEHSRYCEGPDHIFCHKAKLLSASVVRCYICRYGQHTGIGDADPQGSVQFELTIPDA